MGCLGRTAPVNEATRRPGELSEVAMLVAVMGWQWKLQLLRSSVLIVLSNQSRATTHIARVIDTTTARGTAITNALGVRPARGAADD